MRSKTEMLAELRTMLRDVFNARTEGAAYARLARAHGYVDGYMRSLLDHGTITKEELLAIVAQERENVHGPATAVVAALARSDRLAPRGPSDRASFRTAIAPHAGVANEGPQLAVGGPSSFRGSRTPRRRTSPCRRRATNARP
jgi:hypothetical protein